MVGHRPYLKLTENRACPPAGRLLCSTRRNSQTIESFSPLAGAMLPTVERVVEAAKHVVSGTPALSPAYPRSNRFRTGSNQ